MPNSSKEPRSVSIRETGVQRCSTSLKVVLLQNLKMQFVRLETSKKNQKAEKPLSAQGEAAYKLHI